MRGVITQLLNTPSWRGAKLKIHSDNFTFTFTFTFTFKLQNLLLQISSFSFPENA